ncbi:hypothetical protein AAFF_G00304540 [Aldrovandia affinis]|uniref:Uncharacterized protein n=1 Tax=Aldrovandia affinis TaxID=143900 RepID=A0AAD7SPH9_9TELE|nr:hypothetical protein AAFF_G00304540 [Aldrovandia affinis]
MWVTPLARRRSQVFPGSTPARLQWSRDEERRAPARLFREPRSARTRPLLRGRVQPGTGSSQSVRPAPRPERPRAQRHAIAPTTAARPGHSWHQSWHQPPAALS